MASHHHFRLLCMLIIAVLVCGCGERAADVEVAGVRSQAGAVEASCGQCQFGMDAPGCDLAVRLEGTPYFVDGSGIDDHGDAHGSDGLCNVIRLADVSGEIVDGRFVARSFVLRPMDS